MINIPQALESITKLERLKAQIELRLSQHKAEQAQLTEQLNKLGVQENEIEARMAQLSASIQERLTLIESLGK